MKKKSKWYLRLWILFICLFAGFFFLVNPTFQKKTLHDVTFDANALQAHVQFLTSLKPHRSAQSYESLEKAADYIKRFWDAQGFKVQEQIFDVHGKPYKNLIISYLPEGVDISKKGRLIIGAHYDVCMDLPGADDNASGVAVLLELTKMVAARKPKIDRQIDFVAWTLEEPPYYDTDWMGSFVHAKSMKDQKIKVDLAISIEMVGFFTDKENSQNFPVSLLKTIYPTVGNFLTVIGSNSGWTLVRKTKALFQTYSDLPVVSMNASEYIPGIDWSDHRSYWHFGFPAVMLTDTSFYRNANYHQPTDTWDTLNYPKMALVAQGAYGIALGF